MSYLSPMVARKRNRIEQQVSNRKRARIQTTSKKSNSHSQKSSFRIHVPPPKGEFVHNKIVYFVEKSDSFNQLLNTLTSSELNNYVQFLKARYVQSFYGPLVQLLIQHKDNHGIFNNPVDPIRQNIPNYYEVVMQPMDLGTIRDKLACGFYPTSRELINDIRLVFQNAKRYNPPTHFIFLCATNLQKTLELELEKIRTRVDQNRQSQHNHCCSSCHGYPCRLCGEKCLKYSPPVYVCDGECRERILRNATYYIIRGKKGLYCQKCYAKKIVGMDKVDRKNLFIRKKNDDVFPESWIQCSRCKEWLHCVCGLVHPRQASSSYVCPICLAQDPHRVPKPWKGAAALNSCDLSDFLMKELYKCVDEEINKVPNHQRPLNEEKANIKSSLIVRVVSNISMQVSVKKPLIPMYVSPPPEELKIPYQSKCISFFQHRNGYDILLFVLYVHEFGDTVPQSNQRCIYISYLDSVHFLSPRYLRTPLYHCLLNSYLLYAKQHGYTRAHIWACPPSRGDDYIFSHHPKDQRTPNADHLIGWYRDLLAKGVDNGIVSHVSCQVDMLLHINAVRSNNAEMFQRQIRCFSVRGLTEGELPEQVVERATSVASLPHFNVDSSDYESDNDNDNDTDSSSSLSSLSMATTPTTPTSVIDSSSRPVASIIPNGSYSSLEHVLHSVIPYFEGDYLPYVGEDLLKDIYTDMMKPKPVKTVLSHGSSVSSSVKNKAEIRDRILQENITQLPSEFLRKYAKSMLENPNRFMVAYLRPYCSYCGKMILEETYQCNECYEHRTPFFLCKICHTKNIYHPHILQKHKLSELPPISDPNPTITYPFLDKRHEFLRLCQGNFLQFDTLRHSVLSTSIVLEFIYHKVPDPFLDACDSCERVLYDEYYACRRNDDYRLCRDCLNKDGGIHVKTHSQDQPAL